MADMRDRAKPGRRRLIAAGAAGLAALAAPARAQERAVDTRLVLCSDASGSITTEEFRLQREGYALAFEDERLLATIRAGSAGAIAVAFVEWGSPGAPALVVDWQRVHDGESGDQLATALRSAPRSPQSFNAIGDAIVLAHRQIMACPFTGGRGVIDVSGDGPDMRSIVPAQRARDQAVAAGITINALAIIEGAPNAFRQPLADHYRGAVIGGPGAFVIEANTRQSFAAAIFNKLIREVA
jgi:Protein of unknown function (DUF1194)